jgi:hypothetical protein
MTNRSLSFAVAAGALALITFLSLQASALSGAGVDDAHLRPALVQQAGSKYYRHYDRGRGTYVWAPFTEVDTRRGTYVAAPFARVYSGRHGTYVRAPFVDLFVPR